MTRSNTVHNETFQRPVDVLCNGSLFEDAAQCQILFNDTTHGDAEFNKCAIECVHNLYIISHDPGMLLRTAPDCIG